LRDNSPNQYQITGNGYARSEGVSAIFLQRQSQAARNYATVVHAKSSTDGHKQEGRAQTFENYTNIF
jgi:fatty acid synthase